MTRLRYVLNAIRGSLADLLAIGGVVALLRGIAMWSMPAAWIVGGIAVLIAARLVAQAETSRGTPQ